MKLQEKRKVRETDEEEKETDRKQEPQAKVVKESKTPEKLRKPSGNSGPEESKGRSSEQEVRGRTMESGKERGREKGSNGRRHREGQKTSRSQSKERKRIESPLSTRRTAGMFSEVTDNITVVEELDTDDDYENDTEGEES